MLITNQFTFIHIPKTGGNTLREVFERNLYVVYKAEFYHPTHEAIPENLTHLPVVAAVREPMSWYASYHRFINRSPGILDDFKDILREHPDNMERAVGRIYDAMEEGALIYPGFATGHQQNITLEDLALARHADVGFYTLKVLKMLSPNWKDVLRPGPSLLRAPELRFRVDHLLRIETLERDVRRLGRALGLPRLESIELPRRNATYSKVVASDELKGRIRHKERLIYSLFYAEEKDG